MFRHHVQKSAAAAKRYYQLSDYMTEGQRLLPEFGGLTADRLGITGPASKEAFDRLCDNLHPLTGQQLTARMKSDRIVGIDFTGDGPKGFSVLLALAPDAERRALEQALHLAMVETLQEMERAMGSSVRKNGAQVNRTTGNLLYYLVYHDETRPVDGVADMNRHGHAFVLNVTWDPVEQRFKAADFYEILRDMPYYQAAFHQRLAGRLQDMGYGVERKGNFFEVAGIPQSVITKFSRRTEQIEAAAKELGITDPDVKAGLGAKTREHKSHRFTTAQLRRLWVSRLTDSEREAVTGTLLKAKEREAVGDLPHRDVSARDALAHASAHLFERKSSAPARELLAGALAYGVGGFSVEEAWRHLERDGRFTAEDGGRLKVSHRDVLAEEQGMVRLARDGRATLRPLMPGWAVTDRKLNGGQRSAVRHLLESRDFVTMVVGDAGVGKTTLLKEAERGANAAGVKVFAFAPSAAAGRLKLRDEDGFEGADTVARLLVDKQLQQRARGQVILVDEAALMGTRETAAVLKLAKDLDARVWLVGDAKQHKAVSRGAPFELLTDKAGIKPARVEEIQRQGGAYRELVKLARDRPAGAVASLQAKGWLREVPDEERYLLLARDYLEAVRTPTRRGKQATALVIAPTHAEGAKVTDAIRKQLKHDGKLGEEREFLKLTNRHLTEAERGDAHSYQPGDVLQFVQNAKGYSRGERVELSEGVSPPAHLAARFQAFRPGTIKLAVGDTVRVTAGGKDVTGKHRLDNGAMYTVAGFTPAGNIRLNNGWVVAKDFGHLAHGYVTTSVSSQSRTVDRVLVAMGSESLPATNREQLYVSLSRGREWARVYTDDPKALGKGVEKTDERTSATDLAKRHKAQKKRLKLTKRAIEAKRRAVALPFPPQVDREHQRGLERGVAYER